MKLQRLLFASCCLAGIATAALAAPKIEEKNVGPAFTPGIVYTLSPKGMHVATAHGRDRKTLVTVDGVDGPRGGYLKEASYLFGSSWRNPGLEVRP